MKSSDGEQETPDFPNLASLWSGAIDGKYKNQADIFFLLAIVIEEVENKLGPMKPIKFLDLTGSQGKVCLFMTYDSNN